MTDGKAFPHHFDAISLFVSTTDQNDFTVQTFNVPNFPKNVASTKGEMMNNHSSVFRNLRFLAGPIHAEFPSPAMIGRRKDWL
jgi:hypothetical protein